MTRTGAKARPRPGKTSASWRVSWLQGPIYLAAAAVGLLLVFGDSGQLFGWALGALFGVLLLWLTISIFYPTSAEHRCPACSQECLEPLDPTTTRGIRCNACGFVDEEASSFYHAEEAGTLVTIVRREAGLPEAPEALTAPDEDAPPTKDQP